MADGTDFTLIAAPNEMPLDGLRQLQAKARVLRQAAKLVEEDRVFLDMQAAADTNVYAHMAAVFSNAAQKGLAPLAAALGTWIAARAGRIVKIKVGDIEIEAFSAKEAEELLNKAQVAKQANEPKRIHER